MAAKSIKAGEAWLDLTVRDGQFRKSIDRAVGKLSSLGASFRSIGSLGISGGGLAGLQRAIGLIAGSAALTAPIKLAANLEVAEAAFTALTGSAEKARQILEDLQNLAGSSPFQFDQLTAAARSMLNFGTAVEDVTPLLTQMAAISGGSIVQLEGLAYAMGQINGAGRLMGQEWRQLINAGFNPLQEIARTTGRSMQELQKAMEAGTISAADVRAAFASVTGPGGRFEGLLAKIGNTALGQFRKLAAGIKLAVIPLGQELLPSITGVLRRVNELLPSVAQWIKANAGVAKTVGAVAVGAAALLGTIFSMGVGLKVAAFSLSGLAIAFSAITNPITVATAAIAGLGVLLVKFTNIGGDAMRFLGTKFAELANVAGQTFGAIGDALASGNIIAAANVLWAGLALAWTIGTRELSELWIQFKDLAARTILEVSYSIQGIWAKMWAALARGVIEFRDFFVDAWDVIVAKIASVVSPELAGQIEQDLSARIIQRERERAQAMQDIDAEKDARLAAIEAARAGAQAARDEDFNGEIANLRKRQAEAQKAFDESRRQIKVGGVGGDRFNAEALDAALGGIDGAASAAGVGSRSTFSSKLAPQVFGAADSTAKSHFQEAKKQTRILDGIKDNAFRAGRGGFVLVGQN